MSSWCSTHYTTDTCNDPDPFVKMQDDVKADWDRMPQSKKLVYLILARGEFGQLTDASYHMNKAWKDEQKK